MKYALVKSGVVHKVKNAGPGGDPAQMWPDLAPFLIACGNTVRDNWRYDGATFAPPVFASVLSPREFRARFTQAEKEAFAAAAAASPPLAVLRDEFAAAQEIHLDHPEAIAGMDALVASGVIAAARKAEILS